jgi:protein-L-isoaspartate(D-aspartate) O-methyltransferase
MTKFDEGGRAISSSSQPAIMAIMLEQLALQPGHNVLEIGAGTGYNAALMAHIVGEHGHVTTMDIETDLVESARAHLAAAGFAQVQVICGDGMLGYAANAPYDRIILTVAGWDIPPQWLAQLRPDGLLVLPLSFYGPQLSIAFERQGGRLVSRSVKECGFMPIRGPLGEPLHTIQIGDRWEVTLTRGSEAQPQQTDPAVLQAWLRAPLIDQPTAIELSGVELLFRWPLWAALQEPDYVILKARSETATDDPVLDLFPPMAVSMGILTGSGLALLAPSPDAPPPEGDNPFARTFPLHIRSFGPDKTVAARLLGLLRAWDRAGRPSGAGTSVWALPAAESSASSAGEGCITRRWHHFCIAWL